MKNLYLLFTILLLWQHTTQAQYAGGNGRGDVQLRVADLNFPIVGYTGGNGRGDATFRRTGINLNGVLGPTISSFTPASGCAGSGTVTITGTSFTGATAVRIGGTSASSFTVNSATQITATIGSGTTGTIQVTTPAGTAISSTNFTVTPIPTWYLDADNDNYYTGSGITQCNSPGSGYKTSGLLGGGDCNDADNTVNPANLPPMPTLACFETASFNNTTCRWVVSGTRPALPTLACFQTASFNNTTCQWVVTGSPPAAPTGLACYETATFNSVTCSYDITGTQPAAPAGLACYQSATFNGVTCSYDVTGSPPAAPTGLACYQFAYYSTSTCSWEVYGDPLNAPVINSYTPTYACIGATVTISGSGLSYVTSVSFNGTVTPYFTVMDDNTITAYVPDGATTGAVTLTNALNLCPCAGPSFTIYTSCDLVNLSLGVFLGGYCLPEPFSGTMAAAWTNQLRTDLGNGNMGTPTGNEADLVLVSLYDNSGALQFSDSVMIMTDGTGSLSLPAEMADNSYYILLSHRSHVSIRSAELVAISSSGATYDFTSSDAMADNNGATTSMCQLATGAWAMWTGDVNRDGFIGGDDVGLIDNDNINSVFLEYINTDLTGDGFVGGDDVGAADNSNIVGVYYLYP